MSTSATTNYYAALPASTQAALAGASANTSPLQISGLASGLNTQQIIGQLITIAAVPVVNLTQQQTALQTLNTTLTSLQSSLRTVTSNAQALASPTLFTGTQPATSSNASLVSAVASGGAPIGSYSVAVTQMASAASRAFNFTSPTAAGTVTINGQAVSVAAGTTAATFMQSVNSNSALDVYAAQNSAGQIVLSSRSTGAQTGTYIQVSTTNGTVAEDTTKAFAGQNALYSINGAASQSSASNIVQNAIAGVNLTLGGVTATGSPVTVTVPPPGPNATAIQTAVKTFVDSYNSVISQIQSQVSTAPTKGIANAATLFGDSEMNNLLSNMRQANYTSGAGLPSGMASLADIGITTGAATGTGPYSASAVSGTLQIDSTKLAGAIASNPAGVQAMLQSWSQSFAAIVNTEALPGGGIDSRIQGDSAQISYLGSQIAIQNQMLVTKQSQLTTQFANLEAAMASAQSQGNWLNGQIGSISANSTAISSRGG